MHPSLQVQLFNLHVDYMRSALPPLCRRAPPDMRFRLLLGEFDCFDCFFDTSARRPFPSDGKV